MVWSLFVPGEPVARAEKRVTFLKNGRYVGGLADKIPQAEYKKYLKYFIAINRPERLFNDAVVLEIEIYRERPKSAPKKRSRPITKPDLTNYIKLVEDCLKGLVITDDSIIVELRALKYYTISEPGVTIKVRSVEM